MAFKYSGYVIIAALFWGMIGFFVKGISEFGLTPMEIVALRVFFSFFFLFLYGCISKRGEMIIALKDIYLFIGTGILSIAFFNWAYFTSIQLLSISVAVILLYTAPAFVMIMSVLFLKEKITVMKVILLCMTLLGCLLVTGLTNLSFKDGDVLGYLIGLGAGFGYALYSIFGKFALNMYSSFTVSFYTFFVASLLLVPMTGIWTKLPIIVNGKAMIYIVGLSLISTVLAFLLYTEGLRGIESSKASILSTVEPLAALIIGIAVFQESLSGTQLLGGVVIFMSAIFASVKLPSFSRKRDSYEI